MYKCTMNKGIMTFKSDTVTYTITGKTLESMEEVAKEHNLVQEMIRDHAWNFPVVEALYQRRDALLRNLMELYNGRNIQHAEDNVASTATTGGNTANAGRR